ncbi:MAG: hypothetical protein ACTMIR_07545 [Cellulomonadaceae bacterium]
MSTPYPEEGAAFIDTVMPDSVPSDLVRPESRPRALGTVPAPAVQVVNWATLPPERAGAEWMLLDEFVDQIRTDYGLPPTIIPPLWHRHWELVWELSALHTFWQFAYGPSAAATQPLVFHRYFAEARGRLREWVATCGSKLDADRPTRRTAWPNEPAPAPEPERQILDRRADFTAWVTADIARRRAQSPASQGALFLQTEADTP